MPFDKVIDFFNKSVFTKNSYFEAIGNSQSNGYAVIKISPSGNRAGFSNTDPAIKGVIQNNVSFSIEANWSDIGQIGTSVFPTGSSYIKGFFEKGSGVANLVGFSDLGASFASKLIYQKSGRLSISPKMRIVDWNGSGQPIFSSLLLSSYCLPRERLRIENGVKWLNEESQKIFDDFKAKQAELTKKTISIVESGVEKVAEGVEVVADATGKLIDKAMGVGYAKSSVDEVLKDLDDITTLRSSPTPVNVQIGNFFSKDDMVITNADFDFSKEMTENGPLFVDITISLQSRKILTDLKSIGIYPKKEKRARVLGIGENAAGI